MLWLARSGWFLTAYALLRGAGAPGPAGTAPEYDDVAVRSLVEASETLGVW